MDMITNLDRAFCKSLIQGDVFYAVDGTRWRVNGTKEEKLPGVYSKFDRIPDPRDLRSDQNPVSERLLLFREPGTNRNYERVTLASAWLTSGGIIEMHVDHQAFAEHRRTMHIEHMDTFQKWREENAARRYLITWDVVKKLDSKVTARYDEIKYFATVLPYWQSIVCVVSSGKGYLGIDRFGCVHYCYPQSRQSGSYSFKLFDSLDTAQEQLTRTHDMLEKAKEDYENKYEQLNSKYQSVWSHYQQVSGQAGAKSNSPEIRELAVEARVLRNRLSTMKFFFSFDERERTAHENELKNAVYGETARAETEIEYEAIVDRIQKTNERYDSIGGVVGWMLSHPVLLLIGIPILIILVLRRKMIRQEVNRLEQQRDLVQKTLNSLYDCLAKS